jgi:hypothetical protein
MGKTKKEYENLIPPNIKVTIKPKKWFKKNAYEDDGQDWWPNEDAYITWNLTGEAEAIFIADYEMGKEISIRTSVFSTYVWGNRRDCRNPPTILGLDLISF